jgi:hypothetical protein
MIPEKGSIRGVQELLNIVKAQFVDGLRLQELIQKKLQLVSSQILILRENSLHEKPSKHMFNYIDLRLYFYRIFRYVCYSNIWRTEFYAFYFRFP